MTDDEDHMVKISALITRLQSTMDQFGDTCVYIRRGGLSWGAVALNRRDDDKKHGVFELQAQHDRDMLQRAEQVERLIASRNDAQARLIPDDILSRMHHLACICCDEDVLRWFDSHPIRRAVSSPSNPATKES